VLRFYVYGGVDINEGQRETIFSVDIQGSSCEWTKVELNGKTLGTMKRD